MDHKQAGVVMGHTKIYCVLVLVRLSWNCVNL